MSLTHLLAHLAHGLDGLVHGFFLRRFGDTPVSLKTLHVFQNVLESATGGYESQVSAGLEAQGCNLLGRNDQTAVVTNDAIECVC